MNSTKWPRLGYTKCVDGFAQAIPDSPAHKFRCKNVSPGVPSHAVAQQYFLGYRAPTLTLLA